jgi:hypothetical protein
MRGTSSKSKLGCHNNEQLHDSCSSAPYVLLQQQLTMQYKTQAVAAAVSAMQALNLAAAPPGAGGWLTMPAAVVQFVPGLPQLLCQMIISSAVQLLPEQQPLISHHSRHHSHHQQQVEAMEAARAEACAAGASWQLWSWRFSALVEAAVAASPLLGLLEQEEVVLLLQKLQEEQIMQKSSSRSIGAEGLGGLQKELENPQQDLQIGKQQLQKQCGLLGAICIGLSHAAAVAGVDGVAGVRVTAANSLAAKAQRGLCSLLTCLMCEEQRARLLLHGGEDGE